MKKILIVGGATGIGRAAAVAFRQQLPCHIIVGDTNEVDGRRTAQDTDGTFVACDVRSEPSIVAAMEAVGELDVLVYSAGCQAAGATRFMAPETFDRLFDTNIKGFFLVVRHARLGPSACIVAVSSIAGVRNGGPGLTVYGAAKAALIGMVRGLAVELAPNVRVNAVAPGWTDTRFNQPVVEFLGGPQEQAKLIANQVPLGRQATPSEPAGAICFLASCDYATGTTIVIDGGITLA